MAQYQVELYAVALLPISAVEAANPRAAIAKAIATIQSQGSSAELAGAVHEPLLTGEFVRYVVIPSQHGELDFANSQLFLDAAFFLADQQDHQVGLPLYELFAGDADERSSDSC